MDKQINYSIIIPVYNGEHSIASVCARVIKVLENLKENFEIILVDDGSKDGSWQAIKELQRKSSGIKIVQLMKNFGEHNAAMCGLNQSSGEFVIVMDDDGQNPPEEMTKLISKIAEGYDVVYGKYKSKKHSLFRNFGSKFNDWVATMLLNKPKGLYLCSFKIMRKCLVKEVIKYDGPYPYIDGLIFRSTRNIGAAEVAHEERQTGRSGYTLVKLIVLWSNMFVNFSLFPLRISTFIGLLFSGIGLFMGVYFVIDKLMHPDIAMGWASTIVVILVFAGIQLLMLGMIGEYLGRLLLSSNRTPQFIIREKSGFD